MKFDKSQISIVPLDIMSNFCDRSFFSYFLTFDICQEEIAGKVTNCSLNLDKNEKIIQQQWITF